MVLENPRVDLRVSADPATRLHELKWIVDRLHTEHFVLAEIPYREARLVRIASYDDFVKAARQADDLKLQIILIRPEPRDMCMAHTSPAHACCRDPGLLESIIDRFQLDSAAVADAGMQCTIAGLEDQRIRGAATVLHDPPTVTFADRAPPQPKFGNMSNPP